MSDESAERRDSHALEPEIVKDPQERAKAEAKNGLRQYDAGVAAARQAIERGSFRLRPSLILALHREALAGISHFAGNFRPGSVEISKSQHSPPAAHLVPELVEDLCDYVNDHWQTASAIHLAAYVMWRLNWIHPFADGNGRTSRIVSYVVLIVKCGYVLPGTPTIPDQIVSDRRGYFTALDEADAALRQGQQNIEKMESLLSGMLARQLTSFYESVGGKLPAGIS
jgi:Fic family protein